MGAIKETYRLALQECIADVADLLADIEDFTVPGLGEWDLLGLVGHFAREIRTPVHYLELPEPAGPPSDAAHYVAGYLDRRDNDASALDSAIAARGRQEITTVDRHPAELLLESARLLDETLLATDTDRLIATPFGALRFSEYIRTRSLEVTVHGLDIARALDCDWQPPSELLIDAIGLLGEVSTLRGHAPALLEVMTGRVSPRPGEVLPVLR